MSPLVASLASFLLAVCTAASLRAQTPITPASVAQFATADQGRRLLGERDDFVERMSRFDRAARVKSGEEVSVEEYLEFAGRQALDWPAEERAKVEAALAAIRPRLAELGAPLPETVYLVRTTGEEEGGAYYTRGATIVFPQRRLAAADEAELRHTLAHELFHVLSRAQPELKTELYARIGFVPCGEVALPASLAERRITNPDAPRNDFAIKVEIDGQPTHVVPVLYSRTPKYDPAIGGEFFNYLQFKLLAIDLDQSGAATPRLVDGEPVLAEPGDVGGFFEQVGRNTQYIIHPEEILADNFSLLVRGESDVASPEILRSMEAALREHAGQ